MEHFVLNCPSLDRARDAELVSNVGGTGSDEERVSRLVFDRGKIGEVKRMLGNLWRERLSCLRATRDTSPNPLNNVSGGAVGGGAIPKRRPGGAGGTNVVSLAVSRPRRKGTCYAPGRWG